MVKNKLSKEEEKEIKYSLIVSTIVLFLLYKYLGYTVNYFFSAFNLNTFWKVIAWIVMYLIFIGTCMSALEQQRAYRKINNMK